MKKFIGIALAVLSILLCLWYSPKARPTLGTTNPTINLAERKHEDDDRMIYNSIEARHSFLSTFDWYHESWTFEMPFWRPLTMQFFWLESQVLGETHALSWLRVSVGLYVVMLGLLGHLIYKLTGRFDLSIFAIVLMSIPRPYLELMPEHAIDTPGYHLIYHWKDQPDLWANILILGGMLCAISRKWFGAIACCVAAVGFKEIGWLSFPMAFLSLVFTGQLKEVPAWVYKAIAGSIGVLLLLRWSAGPDVFRGFSMGLNHHKYWRFFNMEVPAEIWLNTNQIGYTILGAGLFIIPFVWRPRLVISFLSIIGLFAISTAISTLCNHKPIDIMFAGTFMWETGFPLLIWSAFAWTALFYLLCRNASLRGWAFAFVIMAMLTGSVGMTAPQASNPHCLALPRMFESAFVGCMFLAAWQALASRLSLSEEAYSLI